MLSTDSSHSIEGSEMSSHTQVEPDAGVTELSLGDALIAAVQYHRLGNLDEAEIIYRRILDIEPDQSDTLNFLGILMLHHGRVSEALELIRKSIAIAPQYGERYNNLGNVLLAAERIDEALAAYTQAIALAPEHAAAYSNLGIIYRAQGRFEEAAQSYRRALEIDPDHVEAHANYGILLYARGELKAALEHHAKACALRPHDRVAKKYLALIHATLGDLESAAAIYRKWIDDDPDDPTPKHLLAAVTGLDVPPRAHEAYIESTFDIFADSFDAKLAKLAYRAPQLVTDAVGKAGGPPAKRLTVLDAGCGTGLCGPLLAPYAARMEGVDLSARMLEQARARGVYDDVTKEDLTVFMLSRRDAYDLIVSADTLVYFGELEPPIRAAAGALRAGGRLIFTVEFADAADAPLGYRINPHGRYSHTQEYVARTLADAGFVELDIASDVLRKEALEPVKGLVVTAHKARVSAQESIDAR
jgi:predicted TPR repeat methyltransferase